jgi:hypothetical protein
MWIRWIRWIRIRIRNTDEKGKKTRGDKQGKVVSVIRSLFLKNNWISGSAAARPLVSHSPIRPYEKGKNQCWGSGSGTGSACFWASRIGICIH